MLDKRHHVVIVGAGFGGLAAARAMADLPIRLTVVDARNHHTFQPLLYQVATAGLDADDVCYPTRGVFHRQRNARVRLGRVVGIDPGSRRVSLEDGGVLEYDHLVLASGAVTADFGVPGVAEHAFGLKSAADALAVRTRVLESFELVDADRRLMDTGALTIVIVGGGPTGVELAGGMAELVSRVMPRDHPDLDVRRARVVLVEAADRVLGTFAPKLSRRARITLEAMGVELRLGRTVRRIRDGSVLLDDGVEIAARTVVWAAGVQASPVGRLLGVELHRSGRVVVGDDLSVPSLPEPFVYRDKGSMATIGRHAGVAELPNGATLSGWIGWVAWLALHLVMLIGFRNRANVLVNWAWNYWTYDRASRLILTDHPESGPGRESDRRV